MTTLPGFDVLVVGNGVLGSSAALALLRRDPTLRVAQIGRSSRPFGASAAAGAMLGCFGEATGALLASAQGCAKLAMAVEASARWPSWLEALNEGAPAARRLSARGGTFVIENGRAGALEAENFDAVRRAAGLYGAPCEDVDAAEVAGLAPAEAARARRALYLPGEGSLDAPSLLAGLDAALDRRAGFARVDDDAVGLIAAGGSIAGVTRREGRPLEARHVVLAAGVATQAILETLPEVARRVPRLFAGVGDSLVLDASALAPFPHVIRTPNRAFASGLHLVPRGEARVYVGATNVLRPAPSGPAPAVATLHFLLGCAVEQLNQGLAGALVQGLRVGNRPVSADACPLLGRTSVEGLWLLTGTYRDGLHLSPLLAADLADRVVGGAGLVEHPFQPERRLIALRTRAQAVDETVRHLAASAPGAGAGAAGAPDEARRARAQGIYDRVGGAAVMPIDFVPMIERDPERMLPLMADYYRSFEAAWGPA